MKAFAWLLGAGFAAMSLAMAAPAAADVEKGIDAWLNGDFAEAVNQWRPLAIEGDADAQFNLAQAYKLGRGVPADLVQAEHWYQRAAMQGHVEAEDNYGLALFQNGRRLEALPWLEKSVARGEPRAQYILGAALFNGDFVAKDWVRGYALVTRASATGLPQASKALAQMDQYMPLEERQRAMVLAREIEVAHARPVAPAPAATAANKPVGAPYPVPGEPAPWAAVAPRKPVPATRAEQAPAKPAEPVRIAEVRTSVPKPSEPAPAPRRAADNWRIQLGAFSDAARARTLWNGLKPRIKGLGSLEPHYVKAGAMTRLQAGPFADKADADRQCGAVKAAGQPCLAVRP
ncbi:SPOR domain-containing protein [Sphingomonas sp. LaA6.9]|uniref:SPOR domain-containing protein n=1 Tax=Sphingomonas sp. LaA6.9 TaxID=2919914 RepID=UPI001F4F1814|nr:SPOR domain-containing protein [Sphingomonas sp. LaA6.9]MCJ8157555.1 SPOR domain-containing protein [Sphingomonas sp. LaA6.9]